MMMMMSIAIAVDNVEGMIGEGHSSRRRLCQCAMIVFVTQDMEHKRCNTRYETQDMEHKIWNTQHGTLLQYLVILASVVSFDRPARWRWLEAWAKPPLCHYAQPHTFRSHFCHTLLKHRGSSGQRSNTHFSVHIHTIELLPSTCCISPSQTFSGKLQFSVQPHNFKLERLTNN